MTQDGSVSAMLDVRELSKSFDGVRAVDGVSFTLAPGTRLALIGPNGAGKTTCFNLLCGQMRADAGTVLLDGQPLLGCSPQEIWRRGVARTFQIAAAFASMTVLENIQTVLLSRQRQLYRLGQRAATYHRTEAEALLARLGLSALGPTPCSALAYGDLKRVELALALASAPRLLLMDEPTAGMDPAERHRLMAVVDDLVARDNLAVLFVEHDLDVVFNHADQILVLTRGHLLAAGPPDAIRRDSQVQAAYLGEPDGATETPSARKPETTPIKSAERPQPLATMARG